MAKAKPKAKTAAKPKAKATKAIPKAEVEVAEIVVEEHEIEVDVLESKVKKVKVADRGVTLPLMRNRADNLVIVNGHERYLTVSSIEVAIQRGDEVELPKGSKVTVPAYLKEKKNCFGCGG